MSRKPLVDVDEVMPKTQLWHTTCGVWIGEETVSAVLEDVVTKYEAALDGAHKKATFCEAMRDEITALREENADLRKKLSDMEVQNVNTEPTPGFFNAENMDYLHKMVHTNRQGIDWLSERIAKLEAMANMPSDHDGLDMLHRRIDKLADRVAMLERVRWAEEGEL